MKYRLTKSLLALGVAASMASTAWAEQGVTDTEILVGSNNDLSGPFAAFGAPAVQAANQYFKKINEAGGVHGRKIRFIVEDHGYQVPKAMQGFNKLVNSDKVFTMLLTLGTPINIAGFKMLQSKNIPNVSPLSAARQMLDPPIDLKFIGFSSYYDQMRVGVKFLADESDAKEVCTMFLPTDFGKEIQEGTKQQAEAMGLTYAGETTHKPDEADFVGSLTKLKDIGCDIIGTALTVRQTITVLGTAKKLGWTDVKFIGSSAAFHTAIAKVPGGITEGYYAAAGWSDIAARMGDPDVKAWVDEYQAEFGEFPGTGALLGRGAAEGFVRALEAAGKDLTVESFTNALESLKYDDKIGGVPIDYGPDHQGGDLIVVSKIENGQWKELSRSDAAF